MQELKGSELFAISGGGITLGGGITNVVDARVSTVVNSVVDYSYNYTL